MWRTLLAVLISAALLYWFANRSLYFPIKEGMWELARELGASDVWLTTADGVRLHGWWAVASGSKTATVFLHGNAGNVTHRSRHIRPITAAGSSVLVIDYRGYGKSEGHPAERGLYADADAAYAHLRAQGYSRIVIHGESLGSAVAVDLASRMPCSGLVLEAPFLSAKAVAGKVLPLLGPLLIWSYDSRTKIGRVRCPILVIHGDQDEVIHHSLGRELFQAAPEPKEFWTVPGAGHNDLVETAGEEYRERLARLYRQVVGLP